MERIDSMILLSSTQNCCYYKLGKFTCHPPLHLDGLNFSHSFPPSKMTAPPKMPRSLSRSMTPKRRDGKKKKLFRVSTGIRQTAGIC